MRVVLTAWGSRGDVEPLAGLALRVQDLGAEVTVCAPPDEEFAMLLDRAGLPLVPLGPPVRSIGAGERPPSTEDAYRLAARLVAAQFETLSAVADGCDAMLATGMMPAGARSVAEKLGIPFVLACFHPFGLPSRYFPPSRRPGRRSAPDETDLRLLWEQDAERVNDLYREPLNAHRAAIGLAAVESVRDYVLGQRAWLATDPVLGPWQHLTELELVQTGAWILPDRRPLPDGLEAFLDAGEPPVYVGFGSMGRWLPPGLVEFAIRAAREHGRRVIAVRGGAGEDDHAAAGDCLWVGEVNQQALFRRVAAVVHHGGAGTTTTAALAGAPQLVLPQIVDQPHWAGRVAELGIGAATGASIPSADSLTAALGTALSPKTQARASAVAERIRTDGALVAARLLLAEA